MTTQVDTVVLAGRSFSGEGSSLADATAIRVSGDKVVGTLPIESQRPQCPDRRSVGLDRLESITCLQAPHVTKGDASRSTTA
jgi:hypothetical protein